MKRLVMKFIGMIALMAMFFSYIPMDILAHCSEKDPAKENKMGCGYLFHCPINSPTVEPSLSFLSMLGWLKWAPAAEKIEGALQSIFHPPKDI